MFDTINTFLAVIPFKILHENIIDVEVSPNYYIRVHGNLNTCEKVLIVSHGMGGSRDAGYVVSLANRFSKDSNIAVITHDNAGTFTNKKVPSWNVSGKGQEVFYYDIVEYITSVNPRCGIYLSGFSGGASLALSYLSCTQGFVKNTNKNKIKHSFLVSVPLQEYHPQLTWIKKNTFLAKYIAPAVAYQGAINSLLTGDLKKCFKLFKKPFDIFETNNTLSGGEWYEFKKNDHQNLNITVISSPDDPITPWTDDGNPCFKMPGCKTYLFPGGGHCGFYRLDGKRDHEELIYEHIKKDQG